MSQNLIRLGKSGIEYLQYAWNPYSGCRHKQLGVCPPFKCWAEGITRRHPAHYPNGFEPTFYPEAFLSPLSLKKPARIGVCFMGDLFGDWIDPMKAIGEPMPLSYVVSCKRETLTASIPLKEQVYDVIKRCPQHTLIFLTKNPKGLLKWSPFPSNCWVGFSACNREMLLAGCRAMQEVEAGVKFVSMEPLLEDTWCLPSTLVLAGIGWVIIGAQTRPGRMPEWTWVEGIVEACDKAGIKVFLKDNLGLPRVSCDGALPYYRKDPTGTMILRQELP